MPFGLQIRVTVDEVVIVSYTHVLDGPVFDELPRVPIAIDNASTGALMTPVGATVEATYTLVEMDEEGAAFWRAWAVHAGVA